MICKTVLDLKTVKYVVKNRSSNEKSSIYLPEKMESIEYD